MVGVGDDDVARDLGLGGEDSPWAHDVPAAAAPPLPDSWTRRDPPDGTGTSVDTPPAVDVPTAPGSSWGHVADAAHTDAAHTDGAHTEAALVPSAHRRRPAVIVGALVLVGFAAVATSMVLGGSDEKAQDEAAPSVSTTVATSAPDEAPSTTSSSTTDSAPTEPPTTPSRSEPPDSLPEPERVWVNTPITLGPRLQAMTVPTQIVVLNADGILHVIDVPTGVLRSIDTGVDRTNLTLVVGDKAIAVASYDRGDVTLVNTDGAVHDVDIPGGAGQIVARAGTNDFIVAPSNWTGNEPPPDVLLAADGTMTQVAEGPLRAYGVWGVRYLPATGEAVVNDSGGTYAISADGRARRLSTGDLIASGDNHVLARECDENLACVHTQIDVTSGERLAVIAPDLEPYRGFDASMSLSPDGSLMTYFDWVNTPLARRLLDFGAGTSVVVDSVDQYGGNTAWAADSSGIFVIDQRRLVLYEKATGERIEVIPGTDLGDVVAVAARPLGG
jgi:hypothetical protein